MKSYEIWWVSLDPTIGAEIKKRRPCLIISPNELNYLNTRIIAPITSKGFEAPYRVDFTLLDKKARILCDQIRCVSTERFVEKITNLDAKNTAKVKQILKTMFA
ncbi:type II toxin-antitoxin system PemK/MazF family toxin [Campylobacter magnus]|uniref:type II toxin-antitoxin system PemK/MazF family toxin n=1 Tax=Campylobacter magnus TaxID=3026462 RepID=UPI00235F5083|nr:type II toxin-antitoxin system PemK/MazF family toxin [Campylobacter magnus]MDD0856315.1 type II toxin-antitoxin system PemK/MazF family toxin [Campylobacter magnus]